MSEFIVYKQNVRGPTGSALSLVIANFSVVHFEYEALNKAVLNDYTKN